MGVGVSASGISSSYLWTGASGQGRTTKEPISLPRYSCLSMRRHKSSIFLRPEKFKVSDSILSLPSTRVSTRYFRDISHWMQLRGQMFTNFSKNFLTQARPVLPGQGVQLDIGPLLDPFYQPRTLEGDGAQCGAG